MPLTTPTSSIGGGSTLRSRICRMAIRTQKVATTTLMAIMSCVGSGSGSGSDGGVRQPQYTSVLSRYSDMLPSSMASTSLSDFDVSLQ